LAAERRARL
jgi:hypothetical protein